MSDFNCSHDQHEHLHHADGVHAHGTHEHEHEHGHSHDCSNDHDHQHVHDLSKEHRVSDHGHSHEHLDHPGVFNLRAMPKSRQYTNRGFVVGIGGPVGSGKSHLMLALCQELRMKYNMCAVTNDIFTREDCEFLTRHEALEPDRIMAVETGGCPHAAIREDITSNLLACEELTAKFYCDLILLESGGDNLAADFSRELAGRSTYIIVLDEISAMRIFLFDTQTSQFM